MLISSRSYDEYLAMFDLGPDQLSGSVLDCCAGAAGFVAGMEKRGNTAVAVDPVYAQGSNEIAELLSSDRPGCEQLVDANEDRFVWDWYGTPERRDQLRKQAAEDFLVDHGRRPEVYVEGSLPALPFADDSFDLVLCSHLLFTWSNDLDADWHRRALLDMLRVSRREVRIFPLVLQGDGAEVSFLPEVCEQVAESGASWRIAPVPYEFQRGANQMLVLTPGA